MEQPEISKTEYANLLGRYITREEVRILINRFEQKISELEEKLEVAEKQINSNKQQIGGLYNIQLYGKPY